MMQLKVADTALINGYFSKSGNKFVTTSTKEIKVYNT